MKQSRETCLHRESIIPLGVGYAMKLARVKPAGFVGVPRGGTLSFLGVPPADSFDHYYEEGQ